MNPILAKRMVAIAVLSSALVLFQILLTRIFAATSIANAADTEGNVSLTYELTSLAYSTAPKGNALVIGAGGGRDVLTALMLGMQHVDAVEINPIIGKKIMVDKFPQYSQNLYLRPDVHIHIEDGRSYVRRSPERFQVIQATLVDTWASTAAGAFALSENNLYT